MNLIVDVIKENHVAISAGIVLGVLSAIRAGRVAFNVNTATEDLLNTLNKTNATD